MNSRSKRKLVCGVGINDADYPVNPRVNGRVNDCPFYNRWMSMLVRCYSQKYHKIRPTYDECSVSVEWLLFTNFKKWMESQIWEGLTLDKDLKILGNKIYSESTCLFIPSQLNSLFTDCGGAKGEHPTGVSYHKGNKKYVAKICYEGKQRHLGNFVDSNAASKAYREAKTSIVKELIDNNTYPMATKYLNQHISL